MADKESTAQARVHCDAHGNSIEPGQMVTVLGAPPVRVVRLHGEGQFVFLAPEGERTQFCCTATVCTSLDLAKLAVDLACGAYDLALEVENLLGALNEPNDPPKWVFSLHRMVERITRAADVAHTATLRVRSSLDGVAQ